VRAIAGTNRFKKEFQRHIAGTPLEPEFAELVRLLAAGATLPAGYRDHPLKGSPSGYRDCHLRGDMVVIYQTSPDLVKFVRIGSHSELFGRHGLLF
jgi:mRNA interferase YafQ